MSVVLVADDDPDILALVTLTLERAGHVVLQARDGEEALEVARTRPPDAAVLDVSMPKLDGLAATRALRADEVLAAVPVILLTARAQSADAEQGTAAGASAYVTKPFSPSALSERLDEILGVDRLD